MPKIPYELNPSAKYWKSVTWNVKCECGAIVSNNSLYRHRQSQKHVKEMEKPENQDNQPDLMWTFTHSGKEL